MTTEPTNEGDAMTTILNALFGKSADSQPVEEPGLEARVAALERQLAALLPATPEEAATVRTELAVIRENREREEMQKAAANYFGAARTMDPLAGIQHRQLENPPPSITERIYELPAH